MGDLETSQPGRQPKKSMGCSADSVAAVEIDPFDPIAQIQLAEELRGLDRLDEAEALLDTRTQRGTAPSRCID